MKHPAPSSSFSSTTTSTSALDAYDFDATQEIVDECTRRNCRSRAEAKRPQRSQRSSSASESQRFAEDPSAFAHLLADHFVARETAAALVATPQAPAKSQQLARPVTSSVSLGTFRSWQFGERCLATYRVLFGRPLWASTATSVPPASPQPRKRKHVMPTSSFEGSCSSSGNGVDQINALELEGASTGLPELPTVDELLELPTDDAFELAETQTTSAPIEEEDVLAELAIELDVGLGPGDAMDLLWDFDASEVDGGAMMTEGEEEELRFLAASPNDFTTVSPCGEDMEDI